MSITCTSVSHAYAQVDVLGDVDLRVDASESVALMGPSGTGKSTLLNIVTGLIVPDAGTVEIDGIALDAKKQRQRTAVRRDRLGLLFQSAELLEELCVVDNVAMPQIFAGQDRRQARAAAEEMLDAVGLTGLGTRRVDEISGGQAQRVAIARALSQPTMTSLVADEPTASLDQRTALQVVDLLLGLCDARAVACLIATHDEHVAARCDRVVWLPDINGAGTC